jgi:hypothetical protein
VHTIIAVLVVTAIVGAVMRDKCDAETATERVDLPVSSPQEVTKTDTPPSTHTPVGSGKPPPPYRRFLAALGDGAENYLRSDFWSRDFRLVLVALSAGAGIGASRLLTILAPACQGFRGLW